MKKVLPKLLILSLLLVAFTACKKDKKATSDNSGGGTVPTFLPVISGKVNNVLKSINSVEAHYNGTSFQLSSATNVFGWGIYLNGSAQEGQTYSFGTGNSTALVAYFDEVTEKMYLSETGSLHVVKKDTVNHILELTFQGTFADDNNPNDLITVTEGIARASYTE